MAELRQQKLYKKRLKPFYRICKAVIKLFHPKQKVTYAVEATQDDVAVYVANHSGAFGPISMVCRFDRPFRPWVAGDVMDRKKAADFIFVDFFAGDVSKHKTLIKIQAKVVSLLLVPVMNGAEGIAVHHDSQIFKTFSDSIATLNEGKSIVIFPEMPIKFTEYIFELRDGFVALAHMFYKKTGKLLKFYPVYVGPKEISVGVPMQYNDVDDLKQQKTTISQYLKVAINDLALKQPKHKARPFYSDEWLESHGEIIK